MWLEYSFCCLCCCCCFHLIQHPLQVVSHLNSHDRSKKKKRTLTYEMVGRDRVNREHMKQQAVKAWEERSKNCRQMREGWRCCLYEYSGRWNVRRREAQTHGITFSLICVPKSVWTCGEKQDIWASLSIHLTVCIAADGDTGRDIRHTRHDDGFPPGCPCAKASTMQRRYHSISRRQKHDLCMIDNTVST